MVDCKLLCQMKGLSCISCCTRGIERISKKELDKVLDGHAKSFNEVFVPMLRSDRSVSRTTLPNCDTMHKLFSDSPLGSIDALNKYVKAIPVNRMVCEYLSKNGCLIHPSVIGNEIRHKAPKNNFLRGKCRDDKTCNKEILIKELPKKARERLMKELAKSKDYYEYSTKIKQLIPRVYVQQKLGKELTGFSSWWLSRIIREPEQKNCFRLKKRLDTLISISKFLK